MPVAHTAPYECPECANEKPAEQPVCNQCNPYNPVILEDGAVVIAARLIDEPAAEQWTYHRYDKYTPGTVIPADTDPARVSWELYRRESWGAYETQAIDNNRGPQTLAEAARDYATPYAFGYGTAVITDGMILCPKCFAETIEQSDPSERATMYRDYNVTSLESSPSRGMTCECGEYIPGAEPYCVDCGDREGYNEHSAPHYASDSTDDVICGECLGKAAIAGEATPTRPEWLGEGYRAYEIRPKRRVWSVKPESPYNYRTNASRGTYYRYTGTR